MLTAGAGVVGLKSIRPIGNLAKGIVHVLKSIVIKDPDTGKYTRVKFDPPFVAQSKEVLRKNMQKIAGSAGYVPDPTGKLFLFLKLRKIEDAKEVIKMNFDQYKESPYYDTSIIEDNFDEHKAQLKEQLKNLDDVASGKVPHTKVDGVLKRNAGIV